MVKRAGEVKETIGDVLKQHERLMKIFEGQFITGFLNYEEHETAVKNLRRIHATQLRRMFKVKR